MSTTKQPNVICGQCGRGYASETTYLAHDCPVTGVKPTEPETMGEGYEKIQEASLQRGADRADEATASDSEES